MKLKLTFAISLIGLFILSSCVSTKMQNELMYYRSALEQITRNRVHPQEKMDQFAAHINELLNSSLEYNKPKDGYKLLKNYASQNEDLIQDLYQQVEGWYSGLSTTEKVIEGTRLASKPYLRELLYLVPKVEKKLNKQVRKLLFLSKFLGLFGLK